MAIKPTLTTTSVHVRTWKLENETFERVFADDSLVSSEISKIVTTDRADKLCNVEIWCANQCSRLQMKPSEYITLWGSTILDKINGTPGPPLPPIQWCQNGAFLLLRAFIIALGGMGDNCSTLFCPRLSENHTGVTRSYICYAHHIWSDVASQDNQGKRTRAEIKSVRDSSRL